MSQSKPEKAKRRRPLQRHIIIAIVMMWVIPTTIVVSIMTITVLQKKQEQVNQIVVNSADNALENYVSRLETAVSESRKISYVSDVRDAYDSYRDTGDSLALHSDITAFLSKQYRNNNYIRCAMIYFTDDPSSVYFNSSGSNFKTDTFQCYSNYKRNAHQTVQELAEGIGTDVEFTELDGELYLVRNMVTSGYTPYAVVVLALDTDTLFSSIDGIPWGGGSGAIRLDSAVLGDPDAARLLSGEISGTRCHVRAWDTDAHVLGGAKVAGKYVAYAVNLDNAEITDELVGVLTGFVFMVLLLVPLLLFILLMFDKKINLPIKHLVKSCEHVENGELGYQMTTIPVSMEFAYLTEAFNKMSGRLKDQFERLYREELALRDSKIMALQSQINPHFLNNTLEIINWEARMGDSPKVSRMLESLAIMMGAVTNRGNRQLISLSEEMRYVDAYLYIISERYGSRLKIEKNIDDGLMDVQVPRLILQPIIENAVEHGISPRKSGTLSISASGSGDEVRITVKNSGALSDDDKNRINELLDGKNSSSGNMGIKNVNERIKIIYGKNCGLFINSTDDDNTVSTIIIKRTRRERDMSQ